MKNPRLAPFAAAVWVVLALTPLSAAPWLTFTEVNYRPLPGERLQFVEIYNLGPPLVDMAGWKLEGAIQFTFPREVELRAGECIVIAEDPDLLHSLYPTAKQVVGPFVGTLPEAGGSVTLRSRHGGVAATMRFRGTGSWPATAHGTGHTLELKDAFFDPSASESWRASSKRGGTPGRFGSKRARAKGQQLVKNGERWRFWRGKSKPPQNWYDVDLDDSKWETGKGGFGYGDGDDGTVLDDMRGSYLSVFCRRAFDVAQPKNEHRLNLFVDFDDGFVVFINGKEAARANLSGASGSAIHFDRPAVGSREAGRMQEIRLGPANDWLQPGRNVIAAAAFNNHANSSDLSLNIELEQYVAEKRAEATPWPRLNEVVLRTPTRADTDNTDNTVIYRTQGIELFNPHGSSLSLAGFSISDDPAKPRKVVIPEGVTAPARGYAVLSESDAAITRLTLRAGSRVFLFSPDQLVDGLVVSAPTTVPDGRAFAFGRFRDGASSNGLLPRPSLGAANSRYVRHDVVINEIHYHPVDTVDNSLKKTVSAGSAIRSLSKNSSSDRDRGAAAVGEERRVCV